MAQIQQPQPPDRFNLPQGFTPSVESTQVPPPYYGFQPSPPQPTIAPYNPTLGTQLLEKMWAAATGAFPGSEGIAGGPSAVIGPWYSKLEQVLANKMPKQAPAQQVRGIVQSGGVKPEEVEYSGVENYLSKAPLASKEGLMQHIQQTRPQLAARELSNRRVGIFNSSDEPGMFDVRDGATGRVQFTGTRENAEQYIEENKQLGRGGQPKFSQYTLPGGENYRELLVTMPTGKPALDFIGERDLAWINITRLPNFPSDAHPMAQVRWARENAPSEMFAKWGEARAAANKEPSSLTAGQFTSSHFDEPNVLTHLRVNDRVTPDGKKVLFVEEVQSDWHQKGRQQGYRGQRIGRSEKEVTEQLDAIIDKHESRFGPQDPNVLYKTNPEYRRLRDELDAVTQESRKLGNQVPDAPFKKSWPLLAMKQALSEASRDGKDYVAWTTGAQQAERYDLSKQLDAVNVGRHSDGKYFIEGIRGDETLLRKGGLGEEQLAEHIGKDLAKRAAQDLQKMEGGAYKSYAGVDLKVGGEGMVSFYDKELVNELNKYAKQWGVKVEQIPMKFGEDYVTIEQSGGGYIVREKGGEGERFFEMRSAAKEYAAELAKQNKTYNADRAWALPITPRMREELLGTGQPLFSLGAGLAGGVLAEKLAQPREQTFEQKETASHLTRMGKDVY